MEEREAGQQQQTRTGEATDKTNACFLSLMDTQSALI